MVHLFGGMGFASRAPIEINFSRCFTACFCCTTVAYPGVWQKNPPALLEMRYLPFFCPGSRLFARPIAEVSSCSPFSARAWTRGTYLCPKTAFGTGSGDASFSFRTTPFFQNRRIGPFFPLLPSTAAFSLGVRDPLGGSGRAFSLRWQNTAILLFPHSPFPPKFHYKTFWRPGDVLFFWDTDCFFPPGTR